MKKNKTKNWEDMSFSEKIAGIISLIVIIIVIVWVLKGTTKKSSGGNDSKIEPIVNIPQESQEVPQEQQPELTGEQQIKDTITKLLSGQNNMKIDRLDNIEVSEIEENLFRVEVAFNADDNFKKEWIKSGMKKQMSEIYQALFTTYKTIEEVSVGAKFPMIDKYGDENNMIVYYTTLTRSEADKVNWEADDSTLKLAILPGVWQTDILHPEFK